MRRTGINDKVVFYVRRYSDRLNGSYFEYRENKEVCNPKDSHHFYLKVGGIVFLPKKNTPGKKLWYSAERIKESNFFGSYVYYGDTDRKLRTILYARRKGMPDSKLVSPPGTLHNVIPRYDGEVNGTVIIGMTITNRSYYKSKRRWTRYDGPGVGYDPIHPGFFEIPHTVNWKNERLFDRNRRFHQQVFGIYVGINTSLLMVDITRERLYYDYHKGFIYTLFQEGAFVLAKDMEFWFCFYNEEESEDYDGHRVTEDKRFLLEGTHNLPFLDTKTLSYELNPGLIVFLKSAPNHTFWTIRVNSNYRPNDKEMTICVPTGGQFETVLPWNEGIEEVKRRQSLKPWNKYIESAKPFMGKNDPILSEIHMNINEVYPQSP